MKLLKIALVFFVVFSVCSSFTRKEKEKPVYVMGVSASFLDTAVYFTDIQQLDSVKLEKGIFPNWSAYSYQLKNYLEQGEGLSDRVCAVYYSESKKKLEKTLSKMKNKYQKSKISIKAVNLERFKFQAMKNE